ncbi:MAG: hypothetical protein H6696_21275, partial [Deferribacteres bacterium]|nr:hypothetical protein [Deferribacteres bacterium]
MHRRTFLKKSALLSAATTLPFGFGIGCRRRYDFDTIIRGGVLYDGISETAISGDVGIKNGKIAAVGSLQGKSCQREINAANLVVAPGFIDIHGHSDDNLLIDGRALSKIHQGVTTEVMGQDGDSMAPLNDAMFEERAERYKQRYHLENMWTDFTGYFDTLRAKGIS